MLRVCIIRRKITFDIRKNSVFPYPVAVNHMENADEQNQSGSTSSKNIKHQANMGYQLDADPLPAVCPAVLLHPPVQDIRAQEPCVEAGQQKQKHKNQSQRKGRNHRPGKSGRYRHQRIDPVGIIFRCPADIPVVSELQDPGIIRYFRQNIPFGDRKIPDHLEDGIIGQADQHHPESAVGKGGALKRNQIKLLFGIREEFRNGFQFCDHNRPGVRKPRSKINDAVVLDQRRSAFRLLYMIRIRLLFGCLRTQLFSLLQNRIEFHFRKGPRQNFNLSGLQNGNPIRDIFLGIIDPGNLPLIRSSVGVSPPGHRVQGKQIGLQKQFVFLNSLLIHGALLQNRIRKQAAFIRRMRLRAIHPDQEEDRYQNGHDQTCRNEPEDAGFPDVFLFVRSIH